MFISPPRTRFDLNFNLLGIPARVHPMFWLASLFLGMGPDTPPAFVILFIGVAFVSILVHEMGHALTARWYGNEPEVILYWMGGLAVYPRARESAWEKFLITAAGPGAGFILAGVVAGLLYATGYGVPFPFLGTIGGGNDLLSVNPNLAEVAIQMLFVNIAWGLVNLLPIYPLDGGQMLLALLSMADVRQAFDKTLITSMVAAGICGMVSLGLVPVLDSLFLPLFFILMAVNSWMLRRAMIHGALDEER
jgi:membrane-associated protease RseP (regulator of RpoE activity)